MKSERFDQVFKQKLLPIPLNIEFGDGTFLCLKENFPFQCKISGDSADTYEKIILESCITYWNVSPNIEMKDISPDEVIVSEGYHLSVNSNGIVLSVSDISGIRHALQTLRQLAETERGVREYRYFILPYCNIDDAPVLKFRGIHLCWFPETAISDIEKQIRLAAYLKLNTVVIEPWGTFPFESELDFYWKEYAAPRSEWRRLIDLGNNLGLTIVPQLNILGHASASRSGSGKHSTLNFNPQYASIFEPDGWCWCLSNPETRKILTHLAEELHDFFGRPSYFHIGCDEANSMTSCASCLQHERNDLLKEHLIYFHDLFEKRNTRVLLWHDMFLSRDDSRFKTGYVANDNREMNLSAVLEDLPKDMIICDWEYCGGVPARDIHFNWLSTEFFMKKGFDTLLCPWENLINNYSHGCYMTEHNGFGILGTTWHTGKGVLLQYMFMGTAQGAWNPLHPEAHGISSQAFGKLVRDIDQDMKTNQYENFGFLNKYQIDITKSLHV